MSLLAAKSYKLGLLAHALRFFRPATGPDIVTDSQAPAGAGISDSPSLLSSVAAALKKLSHAGCQD